MNDNVQQLAWMQETSRVENIDAFFSTCPQRLVMLSIIWRSMRDFYRRGIWC